MGVLGIYNGAWYVLAHQKGGGFLGAGTAQKGVLGAGTIPISVGVRWGHSPIKGGS